MFKFLAENFGFLEKIFDGIDQPIILVDVIAKDKYSINNINKKVLTETGLKKKDFIGKTLREAVSPTAYDIVLKNYNKAVRTKDQVYFEHFSKLATGENYYETTIFPILNKDKCVQLLICSRNITKFKLAEQELRKNEGMFKLLAENTIDVIGKLNLRGEVTYASPSIKHMLGYKPSEVIGRNNLDFLYEADRNESREKFIAAIKANIPGRSVFRMICKNKKIIWIDCRYKIFTNENNEKEIVSIMRDITERKALQDEFEKYAFATLTLLEDVSGNKLSIDQFKTRLNKYLK